MKEAVMKELTIICKKLNLPCDFSEFDFMIWLEFAEYEFLTEDFMKEFHKYLDWDMLSMTQKLSEDLIWEFRDRVDWQNIAACQKLRDEFICRISTCKCIDDDDFREIFIKSGIITEEKLAELTQRDNRCVEHIDMFADEFENL